MVRCETKTGEEIGRSRRGIEDRPGAGEDYSEGSRKGPADGVRGSSRAARRLENSNDRLERRRSNESVRRRPRGVHQCGKSRLRSGSTKVIGVPLLPRVRCLSTIDDARLPPDRPDRTRRPADIAPDRA